MHMRAGVVVRAIQRKQQHSLGRPVSSYGSLCPHSVLVQFNSIPFWAAFLVQIDLAVTYDSTDLVLPMGRVSYK